jgi:UDP:flavonoid glycosyltransferase YjiC (YdhE family)
MVTNGGFGGIHFALAHGVPLVIAGDSEDQSETAARVEWAGAGINLHIRRPISDQIRDALHIVLGPSQHRAGAKTIGADIRRSAAWQ